MPRLPRAFADARAPSEYGFAALFPTALLQYVYQVVTEWEKTSRTTQYNFPVPYNEITSTLVTTVYLYAYAPRTGTDWFVDELVEIYITEHLPAIVAATRVCRLFTKVCAIGTHKGEFIRQMHEPSGALRYVY